MKKLLPMLFSAAFAMDAGAQTALPYFTGFEATPADWKAFRKGATGLDGGWRTDARPYAGAYSLLHTYPVGGTTITDDWYVSPPFSLAAGGKIDSVRHLFNGFGTPRAGDTVAIYLLKGNADPALATSRTLLYDFRDARYTADNVWNKTTAIPIPATAGTSYIAFRYHTISNWLDVRFDNLQLSSNGSSGVRPVYRSGADFALLCNPVDGQLKLRTEVPFEQITIYDLAGRVAHRSPYAVTTDIAVLPAGTYVLELSDRSHRTGLLLFTKR